MITFYSFLFKFRCGQNLQLVKVSDPNETETSQTGVALHFAAWKGPHHMAELLLEKGADPNKVDEDGYTPLSIALKWHHMHTANVLRGVEGTKK